MYSVDEIMFSEVWSTTVITHTLRNLGQNMKVDETNINSYLPCYNLTHLHMLLL